MASLPSVLINSVTPPALALISPGTSLAGRGEALFEVIGWERTVRSVFKAADALAGNAAGVNRRALDRMVELARSRVPRDTDLLLSGIEGREDAEGFEFRASGQRTGANGKPSIDYARLVEFGTKPGPRRHRLPSGVASAINADGESVTVRRRAPRGKGHPGTEAQPYFYNSASEILSDLGARHREAMLATIDAEGLS